MSKEVTTTGVRDEGKAGVEEEKPTVRKGKVTIKNANMKNEKKQKCIENDS